MKRLILGILLMLSCGRTFAAEPKLSVDRLNRLDQRGYFTPAFKQAVHDLVNAREALANAKHEEIAWAASEPELHQRCAVALGQVAAARKELALYTHPEDADFAALQQEMSNPTTSAQERLASAQAFLWAYPTDPHQSVAMADLQQTQRLLTEQSRKIRVAAAAQLAARTNLIQRVRARDLSLPEWQQFLFNMSQEDVMSYLGSPQSQAVEYWIYTNVRVTDPSSGLSADLRVNFNGTRVLSVVPAS